MKEAIIKKYSYRFGTNERELFAKQYAISEGETLEEGFYRATEPFTDESKRVQIFKKIMEKRFCPGGRILAGAGTEHRNTTNCFVLGPDSKKFDSLDDVLDLVLKVAATTKVGGGIGINFDPFSSVKNAQPIDIEIYHTLDPSHPDFEDFTAWQYTDITAYGQPKRHYKAPGLLKVDYSERESLGAPIIVVGDSIASIFSAPFEAVRLGAKRVVLDWSNLRAEGSHIRGSGGTSSGAASFAIEVEHIIRWLRLGGHTAGPVNALRLVFQPILRSVRQGGCLPASAMVHTSKGLISIRDIAVGDQVYTFNGLKPVTYKWDKGVQHLLTLKGRGTSFTATPEHKMAVLRDTEIAYVPMKSISVGDTVLFNLTAHQFDQPQSLPAFDIEMDKQAKEITIPELDPDMAWFIGYFLGNGSTSGKAVSIAYNSAYKEAFGGRLERKIAGQLARFGTNVSHYNAANENTSRVRTVSSALAKYIQKHIKRSHETLRVPEFIAKGSIALRSAFIAGLMDSDGSVKTKPPKIVSTIYPEFATELQNLLATLGIPVRFSTQDRSAKGWHDLHTLSLVGFRREYNQLIAPFSVKGELQLKKVHFDYSVPKSSIKLHPRSYRGKWSGQGDMGYHTYLECSGDLPAIPIKVLEVAIADPQETWDIEVAGEENFIANGFHTHNSRRGAGMATLSMSHPDRELFLTAKDHAVEEELGEISAFNISFLVTDQDMQDPFIERVAEHAWQTGDPGLLFVETLNKYNPFLEALGPILSTNPCGEQGLYPGESCDLGAINLSRYVYKSDFDHKLFAEDVLLYTDFLDANIDYSRMPTEQATIMSQRNRRVGLGFMGLHHALIKLGYTYASGEGRRKAASIMELMSEKALEWSESAYDGRTGMAIDLRRKNVALLTVAPTGTTSMIMNVSSGVEPIFSVTYRRKIGSTDKTFMDPLLMEMLREHDPSPAVATMEDGKVEWDEDAVVAAVQANRGSVQGLEFVPRYIQELFLTAQEIHWRDHVLMQGAMQRAMDTHGVGNAISKTINMPNNATVEDVLGAYRLAHEAGCKGITVYRDGSRSNQVLNLDTEVSLECPSGVCEL